jgi:hypothetical protein
LKIMDTVEHAREIVAGLQSKLAAVSGRATDLSTERRRLAYSSATGDAKAKSKLEKLNVDGVRHG